MREPWVTSAAAASSQRGENPKAAIEPSSTTFPAPFRTASFPGSGSTSGVGGTEGATPPTSSTVIRSRFFAVASYRRERSTSLGSSRAAVSWIRPPARAATERATRSGRETQKATRGRIDTIMPMAVERIRELLENAFPDAAEIGVEDRTGTGDHFQVTVASTSFDGLPLLDQHCRVNDALAAPLADGTIHELRIKTKGTP